MKKWVMGFIVVFGFSYGSVSAAADFNGDGHDDIAIFRPDTGLWAVRGVTKVYFGGAGDDPAPGDYDHDGKAEIAVHRPSTGLWAVRGVTRVYYGNPSDVTIGGNGGRWLPNGSDIYYNAGKVGIGTSSPQRILDIGSTSDTNNYVGLTSGHDNWGGILFSDGL